MSAQVALLNALKDLEGDLRLGGVTSCAIVYLDDPKAPEGVRRVLEEVQKIQGSIHYSQNCVDAQYLEGSDYRLEVMKMTRETMIVTLVGRLVLPAKTTYRITSRR